MNILVYGDSLSWGIIPGSRNRLPFNQRWAGVLQQRLGQRYRVVEECLNGRTTNFEDPNRPARNGLEHIQMILESHSPIELIILFLGINDFQDIIQTTTQESSKGLKALVEKMRSSIPEPMKQPAKIMVIIPPEIENPLGAMSEKFSQAALRGKDSEEKYIEALEGLDVSIVRASEFVMLSKIDGIHLDKDEHETLGNALAEKILRQQKQVL